MNGNVMAPKKLLSDDPGNRSFSEGGPIRSEGITEAILAAVRAGDPDAFRMVYLHYVTPLKEFLTILLRNEEEAKEITQDVFVKLWEKRADIDPGKNVKGLIYTVARNLAMNHFGHRKAIDNYTAFARNQTLDYISSDEIVIARETELLIQIAVSRMPDQRRRVFVMSREEGLSNDEIATRLDISKHTVDNHLAAAKKTLKTLLSLFLYLFV